MAQIVTRLAPSPTGRLHLGNAWSFLLCWLAAHSSGGKVFLRIDDIDPQRSKPEFSNSIIYDLLWLGLNWDNCDEGAIIYQSSRQLIYADALKILEGRHLVYPCFCTRKELRSLSSAPHIGDEGPPYPGVCANLNQSEQEKRSQMGSPFSLRLRCPEHTLCFTDLIQGPQCYAKAQYGGDFALRRSDGVLAYQLASAVDDAQMGINFVMRGRDLLPSTPRQIILSHYLGYQPPTYAHIPLLLDPNGERLAKRHASLALSELRKSGMAAESIVGYLAFLAGINPEQRRLRPDELLHHFTIANLPKRDIRIDLKQLNALK